MQISTQHIRNIPHPVYSKSMMSTQFSARLKTFGVSSSQQYEFMHESNNPICPDDMQRHKEEGKIKKNPSIKIQRPGAQLRNY